MILAVHALVRNATARTTVVACSHGTTTARTIHRRTIMLCVLLDGIVGYMRLRILVLLSWKTSIRLRARLTGVAPLLHLITRLPRTLVSNGSIGSVFASSASLCAYESLYITVRSESCTSAVVNGSLARLPPPDTHFDGSNFNLSNNLLTMDPDWAVPNPRESLNFDLAPSSPAFAMGFQRIPSECFGPWRCGASANCPC